MKIAAWNLNHRTLPKAIPPSVIEVVEKLAPDVLVLTEYVDGGDRSAFKEALEDIGLTCISVSDKRTKHNQVLMASRLAHVPGGLAPPAESHAETNFHAVRLQGLELSLVGIRVPAYKRSAEVHDYWAKLTRNIEAAVSQRLILIGDLNADPDQPGSVGGSYLKGLRDKGWGLPTPTGEWSYISNDGCHRARIDHVLASPAVKAITASYVTEVGRAIVAGPGKIDPISDHAIIICEVMA